MSRSTVIGATLAVALAALAGYRVGSGAWPFVNNESTAQAATKPNPAPERKVLYWKDPDGKADFSPTPKKSANGRDYLPVFEDEESPINGTRAKKPTKKSKILYYRNPMGLADTSPVPKKDWMGMDYIPVYEGEEEDKSTVKVSLDKVQRAGVRSEAVARRVLSRPVKAPGTAKPDERTLRVVSLRADGFIEKLLVNTTGQFVTAGEPMFTVYSPQMVAVQVDYRNAMKTTVGERRSEQGALQRLRNLNVPESVIAELKADPEPRVSIPWPAPISGIVLQKNVIEGQMAKAGEELFRLAELTSIWVIADVAEQDVAQVKIGSPAKLAFRAFPGEIFEGKVTFILHDLDAATRTAKVRIEVNNADLRIRHEMFADVTIDAGTQDRQLLAVPASAVIDSGTRRIVILDKGEGRFEPRPVKVGLRGDGYVEILEGVQEGDKVIVAANFLIDAESNLRAALATFTAEPADKPEAKP